MRLLAILLISTFALTTQAAYLDMGIVAGYRSNDGDATNANEDINGGSGLVLGGTAYIPIATMLQLRTGFLLNQRYYTIENSALVSGDQEVELMYVDVPLTALFMFSEFGGAFAGLNLAFNASDDCSPSCNNVEDFVTPIQFGGFFKVGPQIGIEVFYEMLSGDLVDGIEDTTAVGASVVFTLE